ncbi:hypothetical protein AOQ84DRAFT_389814 [Glonium stellatum]|uniref:Uncharacterized protein n=1 Tax=Glonium stellatum TaxID=574774 RepID=A0A8E2EY35_9PEZI|nr:hypothetical protein AOQ84DRAFT_389814 [Glonium stellatum]
MAEKYIPPALRRKDEKLQSSLAETPPMPQNVKTKWYSYDEIYEYFQKTPYIREPRQKALQGSAENPSALSVVFIFFNLNSKYWGAERSLLVKINDYYAKLLPIVWSGTTQTLVEHKPFAVYEQISLSNSTRSFAFAGWYKIVDFKTLPPNSSELEQALRQTMRLWINFGEKVTKAMKREWVVIMTAPDEEAEKEMGEPEIRPDTDELLGPSVTERLQAMRMEDSRDTEEDIQATSN